MKVYNRCKERVEPAKYQTCPRCKGSGGRNGDEDDCCHLCRREGKVWVSSSSGWTRVKYARLNDSKLY